MCSQNLKKQLFVSSCPSVHLSAWNNSAPTGRIFMKFDIGLFFENLLRKVKFNYNQTRITSTVHEDQYTLLITSHSVLYMKTNTHFWSHLTQYCTWRPIHTFDHISLSTVREDQYTLLITSHSVRIWMINVSDKICRDNQNTHFVFKKFFQKRKKCAFYMR